MYLFANTSFQNSLIPFDTLHLVQYLLLRDEVEETMLLKGIK
jgi:hypothetical protein